LFFSKDKKSHLDEELYERCYYRVFTAVNLIARDPDLAEDAVQEGFYKAFCNISQLREQTKFCAWVMSIAINDSDDAQVRKIEINGNEGHLIKTKDGTLILRWAMRGLGIALIGKIEKEELIKVARSVA